MSVSPQVLPGRAFQATTPNSNLFFHWRAQSRDLATVDRLSTGTLTRASAGGLTDGRGQRTANALTDVRLVGPAADNQPRWGVSSAGVPHLLLEDTRTNFQPISNPTTGWQVSSALSTGGETTVAPDGTLVTLLTDASTAATQRMEQDVEVASTVAIVTWYTKWNGSTFGDINRMRFIDGTTGADRGRVLWEFGSTGAMAVTSTVAGTVISAPAHIGNNWWKTSLECAAISTGNDNQIEIAPARTAAGTIGGDMFIAHVQVEDVASTGLFATSHMPTVSAAVTRAAETLSFTFLPVPQETTVYCKFVEGGTLAAAGGLFFIGADAISTDPRFFVAESGGFYRIRYDDGAVSPNATLAVAPSIGDVVEIRAVLAPDGSVTIGQSINGGGETTATDATKATIQPAWAGTKLFLNSLGTASSFGFNKFREFKVSAGTKSMQQMREGF